jgi:hypothetical protein
LTAKLRRRTIKKENGQHTVAGDRVEFNCTSVKHKQLQRDNKTMPKLTRGGRGYSKHRSEKKNIKARMYIYKLIRPYGRRHKSTAAVGDAAATPAAAPAGGETTAGEAAEAPSTYGDEGITATASCGEE